MLVTEPKSRVLCINSYAGSLLIAAKHLWYPVIGSYEDKAYGIDIQKANFDNVDYRDTKADWPTPKRNKLKGVVVMAHPPCAAFSQLTKRYAGRHGLDADAFKCTKDVLEYTMSQGADAIMLESVTGALEGARSIHDDFAGRYGYQVYRILQNSITFAVPQWRPRFWVVFVHKRFKLPSFMIMHQLESKTIGDIIEDEPSAVTGKFKENLKYQHQLLMARFGTRIANDIIKRLKFGAGAMPAVLWRMMKGTDEAQNQQDVKQYCYNGTGYTEMMVRLLDPTGYAPTVLAGSFWVVNGRCVTDIEFNRIMGFPDHYIFPEKRKKQHRAYLSRGVCPPVAMWLLDLIEKNLHWRRAFHTTGCGNKLKPCTFPLRPGEVADLRPSKKLWQEFCNS